MAEELMKIENAVIEEPAKKITKPQRNYKKELEEATARLESVTEENVKLHQYVDGLFKQSETLNNKLAVTANSLAQLDKAITIMGNAYDMVVNQLNSLKLYLKGDTK